MTVPDPARCRECRRGLEHCHGTLIVHALRFTECTEPDCDGPETVHGLRLDCEALGCACATDIRLAI